MELSISNYTSIRSQIGGVILYISKKVNRMEFQ